MFNSSKARETATIKLIEDQIRDASLKGEFEISVKELSDDAKDILIEAGYTIVTVTGEYARYDICWNK